MNARTRAITTALALPRRKGFGMDAWQCRFTSLFALLLVGSYGAARTLDDAINPNSDDVAIVVHQDSDFGHSSPKRERGCIAILRRLRFGLVSTLTRKLNINGPLAAPTQADTFNLDQRRREHWAWQPLS